jgi:hypothetical protein
VWFVHLISRKRQCFRVVCKIDEREICLAILPPPVAGSHTLFIDAVRGDEDLKWQPVAISRPLAHRSEGWFYLPGNAFGLHFDETLERLVAVYLPFGNMAGTYRSKAVLPQSILLRRGVVYRMRMAQGRKNIRLAFFKMEADTLFGALHG